MFEIINELDEEITESEKINDFLNYVVKKENLDNCLFNIILVDNEYIHKLNKEYRGIDKVTDVISFALEDSQDEIKLDFRVLGDIYISIDKAKEQALEYGHSFLREFAKQGQRLHRNLKYRIALPAKFVRFRCYPLHIPHQERSSR